jgi:hypothetical protein
MVAAAVTPSDDFAPARVLALRWLEGRMCLLMGRYEGRAREFYWCPLATPDESNHYQISFALATAAFDELHTMPAPEVTV